MFLTSPTVTTSDSLFAYHSFIKSNHIVQHTFPLNTNGDNSIKATRIKLKLNQLRLKLRQLQTRLTRVFFFAMKQENHRVTGVTTVVTLRYDLFAVQLVSRCNERA